MAVIFLKRRKVGRTRSIAHEIPEVEEPETFSHIMHEISADSLMGKMPNADSILKKDELMKLTSSLEWKPMQVALTAAGIFMSRPDEDLVRDLIPLCDILEVRKRDMVPGTTSTDKRAEPAPACQGSFRNRRLSTLVDSDEKLQPDLYMLQILTIENGYNSGRTYNLNAQSEEMCSSWIQAIRLASDKAILLQKAGPGLFQRSRYRLGQFYRSITAQSIVAGLISCGFLINILQTELLSDVEPGSNEEEQLQRVFSGLEFFFTVAFTIELLLNMFAHFFLPFFKVRTAPLNVMSNLICIVAISSSLAPARLPPPSLLLVHIICTVTKWPRRD
jgi:hypothetical protein